jgi:hypothetical protein
MPTAKWVVEDAWLEVCLNCPLRDCVWTRPTGCPPINSAQAAGLGPEQTAIILVAHRSEMSFFETARRLQSELSEE